MDLGVITENRNTEVAVADQRKSGWLVDLEQTKGFAIFLVVWAHVYDPNLAEWALSLRHAVYAFHMPLFMFLSGFIFIHAGYGKKEIPFFQYIRQRAYRLLLPFFAMAFIATVGKSIMAGFLHVDRPVGDIFNSFVSVFYNTESSPVQFIWYLVVLFYYSVLTNFLHNKMKVSIFYLLIFSLFFYSCQVFLYNQGVPTDYFYLNKFSLFYVFFIIGCIACHYRDYYYRYLNLVWLPSGLFFLLTLYVLFNSEWRYLIVGCFGILFFHGAIFRLFHRNTVLKFLGENALAIYLFNMIFIGIAKGIFMKLFVLSDSNSLQLILICTAFGLCFPILIRLIVGKILYLRPVYKMIS